MNRLIIVLLLIIITVSCKKESETKQSLYPEIKSETTNLDLGKKIFNGKGQCITCHKTTQKVIGPSVVDIVSIYEKNNASMVEFLKGNLDPIVDPSQFQVMKVNLEITKKMTDEELQSVVDYMYHISGK